MTEGIEKDRIFFARSALDVRADLLGVNPETNKAQAGGVMELEVETSKGLQTYRFVDAKACLEEEATRPWNGSVLEEIRGLESGIIVVYTRRAGRLPFIKTVGGDNVEILRLEGTNGEGPKKTPTEIANLLGLGHRQKGRLRLVGEKTVRFERLS